MTQPDASWGRGFDPDRLANLELAMWKAYYRRQPARLFRLLVRANREQAGVGWARAVMAAVWLARGASRFGQSTSDYDRFLPDIAHGYRLLGLPESVDADEVARRELRWWVVRREIGLAAGASAGEAIGALYAALYGLPEASVAEAGRLRGLAAEVRDRGATVDPAGPAGPGTAYWPEVASLLRASYRHLKAALEPGGDTMAARPSPGHAPGRSASNEYAFLTEWELTATPDEIVDVLGDASALARWWPSVYLRVDVLEPGDDRGVGKVVDLYTKGWLPYTLRWRFEVTESDVPRGFAITANGDFVGRGIWAFEPLAGPQEPGGPRTRVTYDWRIVAEKGILKRLSFLMKPVFSANHRWAMARGEESLRLELARRRAAGDAAVLAAIPAPPGPTFTLRLRRP